MLAWGCERKETGILRWDGKGTRTGILVGQQCCWDGAGVITKIGILEWSGGYWTEVPIHRAHPVRAVPGDSSLCPGTG